MTDRAAMERARRRLAALKGLYIHSFVFGLVLAGLLALNAVAGGGWWVQWVFLGWGAGLAAHAIAAFWRTPQFVSRWEHRKLRQLAGR